MTSPTDSGMNSLIMQLGETAVKDTGRGGTRTVDFVVEVLMEVVSRDV